MVPGFPDKADKLSEHAQNLMATLRDLKELKQNQDMKTNADSILSQRLRDTISGVQTLP